MGDMTDYYLSSEDCFDDYDPPCPTSFKTCLYCGKGYLHWETISGKQWRLFTEDGKLHICKGKVKS
jgi:hypothetical protein